MRELGLLHIYGTEASLIALTYKFISHFGTCETNSVACDADFANCCLLAEPQPSFWVKPIASFPVSGFPTKIENTVLHAPFTAH